MSAITEFYTYLFHDIADKRVESWALMKDPSVLCVISFCYLYFVLRCGPRFMEKRPAYDLRRLLQVYNIIQVAACIYLVKGFWENGWRSRFSPFKCYSFDLTTREEGMLNLLNLAYWTTILKIVELLETVFFVLRKKQNQVTYLHLYHHVSTMFFMWTVAKYTGGGMASFYPLLNSIVHIVMYTYYFLATLGPEWQKILAPLKPKITTMQMVQFVIMILHTLLIFTPNCTAPRFLTYIFIVNILINFGMFYNFFQKSYKTKSKKKLH